MTNLSEIIKDLIRIFSFRELRDFWVLEDPGLGYWHGNGST